MGNALAMLAFMTTGCVAHVFLLADYISCDLFLLFLFTSGSASVGLWEPRLGVHAFYIMGYSEHGAFILAFVLPLQLSVLTHSHRAASVHLCEHVHR